MAIGHSLGVRVVGRSNRLAPTIIFEPINISVYGLFYLFLLQFSLKIFHVAHNAIPPLYHATWECGCS